MAEEREILKERQWTTSWLLLAVLFILPLVVTKADGKVGFPLPIGYVSDHAQVLTIQSRSRLEDILETVNKQLGVEFAIVTLRGLDGADPAEYANRLYEEWGIGDKESNRGILILDLIDDTPGRSYVRVEVGYGLEGVLPDGRVGRILDRDVIPHLREGNRDMAYARAIIAFMRPVLAEVGRDPAEVNKILSEEGYRAVAARSDSGEGSIIFFLPLIVMALILMRSRTGRGLLLGSILFGGMGGAGRSGGGFGGGFGGFGGGLSGGGGAGRGY